LLKRFNPKSDIPSNVLRQRAKLLSRETIAASDLNARAALYADADPFNDPPPGVPNRGCVYCHATVSEPGPNH
jgi:hypothetical protein